MKDEKEHKHLRREIITNGRLIFLEKGTKRALQLHSKRVFFKHIS